MRTRYIGLSCYDAMLSPTRRCTAMFGLDIVNVHDRGLQGYTVTVDMVKGKPAAHQFAGWKDAADWLKEHGYNAKITVWDKVF